MMTMYSLIAPKSNKPATSSCKNGLVDGQQSADECLLPKATSDKDKANGKSKSGFDETLRKKMSSDSSHETHDQNPKKDKSIKDKDKHLAAQEICNQKPHNPEKEISTPNETGVKMVAGLTEDAEVNIDTLSSLESAVRGNQIHQGPVVPKTPMPEIPAFSADAIKSGSVLNQTDDGLTESVQAPGDTGVLKMQNLRSVEAIPGQNKISPEINQQITLEQTDNADIPDSSSQENFPKTAVSNTENEGDSIFRQTSAISQDKPAPTKTPMTSETEESRFTANQKDIPSQDKKIPQANPDITSQSQASAEYNSISSSRTSVYRMNLSTEQINSIKSENQKISPESRVGDRTLDTQSPLFRDTIGPSNQNEPISAETVKSIANTPSGLSVSRQIQESVNSQYRPGAQQIIIRLDPPELGRVTIRFIEQNNGITGVLHVDKADTKQQIQQALPGIIQNLENSNVPIRKLEVILNNQTQYNTPDENAAGYNGSYEQQNTPNHGPFTNTASYSDWPENSNCTNDSQDSGINLTDKSINMLI